MRAIGVLGGMGPEATLDFLAKLFAADRQGREQDRLRVFVDCNPAVLDRNAALRGQGPSPGPMLAAMARGLEASGAECLAIACNTAHAWRADVSQAVTIPLIDMIETACAEIVGAFPDVRRVGLLAAEGCLEAGLYQAALTARGLIPVTPGPSARLAFMDALYRIKAGEIGEAEKAALVACAREVQDEGAEAILAACTEVPLVLAPGDLPLPMIDAADALARRVVAFARA